VVVVPAKSGVRSSKLDGFDANAPFDQTQIVEVIVEPVRR